MRFKQINLLIETKINGNISLLLSALYNVSRPSQHMIHPLVIVSFLLLLLLFVPRL